MIPATSFNFLAPKLFGGFADRKGRGKMKSEQSRLAAKFVKDNKIKHIDAELIKSILENKGFCIVNFSHVVNDNETELMIKSLFGVNAENLPPAVSVDGKKGKFVFLSEELNQRDKLYALCVQTGLILGGNVSEKPNDTKVEADRKAHEFAESLLGISDGDVFEKARAFPVRTAVKTVAGAVFVLLLCFSVCFCAGFYLCRLNYESSAVQVFSSYDVPGQNETPADVGSAAISENNISDIPADGVTADNNTALFDEDHTDIQESGQNENVFVPKSADETAKTSKTQDAGVQSRDTYNADTPEVSDSPKTENNVTQQQPQSTVTYYMTSNGTKYHKAGCSYIANKENLKEISSDSAELSKYSPCSRCFK